MKKTVTIQYSKNTFFVDRTVFGNTFPDLKDDRLRIYLLMCRVVGVDPHGTFFMGINTTAKEVNTTPYHVRQEIDWLCQNHFIKKVGRRRQANMYKVLVVPDYHQSTDTYLSNENIPRTRYHLKDINHGYCELPIQIMMGSILRDRTKWTNRKIKVLGQLYQNHWIDEYGGVDPQHAHFKNNTVEVSELFTQTVECHANQVIHVVEWLLNEGYLQRIKTIYRVNQNSCHNELQYIGDFSMVSPLPNDVIIDVIRMNCIPDLKVKDAKIRTGGNIAV